MQVHAQEKKWLLSLLFCTNQILSPLLCVNGLFCCSHMLHDFILASNVPNNIELHFESLTRVHENDKANPTLSPSMEVENVEDTIADPRMVNTQEFNHYMNV